MAELDRREVADYFERDGTVARWWTPDSGELSFHYDAELRILDDHLEVDPDWRVLDVGTGRGRFGTWFARKGCSVTGIDLNPEMLAAARMNAEREGVADRFELLEGRAEDLSRFPDAAFDVVLCMELFDHLPELDRGLAEMRRVVKSDGRQLFTFVPSQSLYGMLGNLYRFVSARGRRGTPMISRTYSHSDVRRRLARSGFELQRYWGIGALCLNAQTRLFSRNPIGRALTALARAEARRHPYYEASVLARHGAHVLGLAQPVMR